MGKGSDHIEGESIEQAERHLGIVSMLFRNCYSIVFPRWQSHLSVTVTARSVLDGNDAAKEKEDNCQVSKSLFREAAEGRDDDPDVSTWTEKKDHIGGPNNQFL